VDNVRNTSRQAREDAARARRNAGANAAATARGGVADTRQALSGVDVSGSASGNASGSAAHGNRSAAANAYGSASASAGRHSASASAGGAGEARGSRSQAKPGMDRE
jgi:hypothetical protein